MSGEYAELTRRFISIVTKGRKDNTYKFALARFLVDYVYFRVEESDLKSKLETNDVEIIPVPTIARSFLKYYWHQICKFKIRQNYHADKPPLVVKIIQNIFGTEYYPGSYNSLDTEKKIVAEREIARKCFSEVIPRFHTISDGYNLTSKEIFYEDRGDSIAVKPIALQFFKENYVLLCKTILLEWAKYLEKINRGLPMLISKIESDEVHRNSLEQKYRTLRKYFDMCFYCDTIFGSDRSAVEVDHFIPWSYIFEDELWNLVLACRRCNNRKRDCLYPFEYVNKIINRNEAFYDKIIELKKSLFRLDTETEWKKALNQHYQGCKDYGFPVVNLASKARVSPD